MVSLGQYSPLTAQTVATDQDLTLHLDCIKEKAWEYVPLEKRPMVAWVDVTKSAESAVQQVKDKGYLAAYRNKASHFHIIGINFDSENRKVDGRIWEEV